MGPHAPEAELHLEGRQRLQHLLVLGTNSLCSITGSGCVRPASIPREPARDLQRVPEWAEALTDDDHWFINLRSR